MEKDYRRTATKIAVVMIMQFCLWYAASFLYSFVSHAVFSNYGPATAEVCEELLFALLYAVSFGLPVISARIFYRDMPMSSFDGRPSKYTVPMVLASIGIIYAAAIVNNLVTLPFDAFGLDIYTLDITMTVTPATVLAKLISLVIVPALLEELLFRGVILGSLLPYGKTEAVLVSALLFAMMHQNPKQFIYTFAAGCVMGYFVAEGRSLFLGIIIHAVNNFISLVNMIVYNICSKEIYAAYSASLCTVIFAGAAIAVPLLISNKNEQNEDALIERSPHMIKNLLSPLMIVYFLLSIGNFVFTMIVSRLSV